MTDRQPSPSLDISSDLDPLLSSLADPVRRETIHFLNHHRSPVALNELVEHLISASAKGAEIDNGSINPEQLEISLVHVHLPKLEAVGLVEVSNGASTISPTGDLPVVATFLNKATPERQDRLS